METALKRLNRKKMKRKKNINGGSHKLKETALPNGLLLNITVFSSLRNINPMESKCYTTGSQLHFLQNLKKLLPFSVLCLILITFKTRLFVKTFSRIFKLFLRNIHLYVPIFVLFKVKKVFLNYVLNNTERKNQYYQL